MAKDTKNNYVEQFIALNKKDDARDLSKAAETAQKNLAKQLRSSFLNAQSQLEAAQNELEARQEKLENSYYTSNVNLTSIITAHQDVEQSAETVEACEAAKKRLYNIAEVVGINIESTI